MDDLISRQAAIDEIKEIYEWHDNVTKERIIEHFKQLPSAERHGRWENDGHTLACSNCHTINIRGVAWYYCPYCGAKMEGIDE